MQTRKLGDCVNSSEEITVL